MISFWLAAGGLLLIFVGLILWPYLRVQQEGQILSNLAVIRQRMAELEQECADGLISNSDLVQAKSELKLALVQESSETEMAEVAPTKRRYFSHLFGVIAIAIVSGTYFHASEIGHISRWQQALHQLPSLGKRIVVDGDTTVSPNELMDFALGLRTRLSQDGSDATGWMLLGRVLAQLNQLDEAIQAFEKSLAISPDKTGALSGYAQALLMTGQESAYRRAVDVLKRVLQLEPDDLNATGMLAMAAGQLGDNVLALQSWQSVLTHLPETDPMHAAVQQQIASLQGTDATGASDVADNKGTHLAVTVALDERLQSKLPKDGYLIVFAQDPSGTNRMPAAVIKQKLAAFPVTIDLSDANSMVNNFTLSDLSHTRLVARISADGNVMQAAGDLQGEITVAVQVGETSEQTVVIDKELM